MIALVGLHDNYELAGFDRKWQGALVALTHTLCTYGPTELLGRHLATVRRRHAPLQPLYTLLAHTASLPSHALSRITTASILHFKEHTTYCLRLSTATGT